MCEGDTYESLLGSPAAKRFPGYYRGLYVSAGWGKVAVIFSVIRPKSGGTVPPLQKVGGTRTPRTPRNLSVTPMVVVLWLWPVFLTQQVAQQNPQQIEVVEFGHKLAQWVSAQFLNGTSAQYRLCMQCHIIKIKERI